MKLNSKRLLEREFSEREFIFTEPGTDLYALSAGMVQDPLFEPELMFVCVSSLRVLPHQATVERGNRSGRRWHYNHSITTILDET